MAWRIPLVAALLAATLSSVTATGAETPPPVQEWPYRFTLTGPKTATPGSDVTYRVEYDLIEPGARASPAFVFTWPAEAASYLDSRTAEGPSGKASVLMPGHSVRWDFDKAASGAVEVVLHVAPDFSGDMHVGIYVPGTGIQLPPESIERITTAVAAAPELPDTGHGSRTAGSSVLPATLAVFGMMLAVAAVALRRRTA